ncbi:MAG: hypothetical protein ACOZD0_01910 [Pseudomonadota bacterium]
MDALSFIAELVKALAWPLATVAIAVIFRSQLVSLLGRLKGGKLGPAEFAFERAVEKLEAAAVDLPSTAAGRASSSDIQLATTSPRAAIIEAWLEIEENAIAFALCRNLVQPTARRNPMGAINGVYKSGFLSESQKAILRELQELRNDAAHNPDFSPSTDSVLRYVRLAKDLCIELVRNLPPEAQQ